jgi:hypothetical protein
MLLYERLGIKKDQLIIDDTLNLLKKEKKRLNDLDDVPGFMLSLIGTYHMLIQEYYYWEENDNAKKYINDLLIMTKDYFWGDWRSRYDISKRKPADPKTWKSVEPWTTEFRNAVLWASCINDWKSVYKFAEYPADNCPLNRYEPRREGIWFLLLAAALRGEKREVLDQYADMIKNGKQNKYQKILLSMLYAVLEKDSASFNKELDAHLKYCEKYLFNSRDPRNKVTMDGSFLINYARYKGLTVEYAPEHEDRIIKLQ